MSFYLDRSRSTNTAKKYKLLFKKFSNFSQSIGIPALPTSPFQLALYITSLLEKDSSFGVISSSAYAVKWINEINGTNLDIKHPTVKSLLEAAKRKKRKPTNRKDPIDRDIVTELARKCDRMNLTELRDLTIVILSFSGFLRFDEVSSIRRSEVKLEDDHIALSIPRSKNDQYRDGSEVLISKGTTEACPLKALRDYLQLAKICADSDKFIFRPIYRRKDSCNLVKKDKPISYSTARARITKLIKSTAKGKSLNVGLHSLRSGGATVAANSNVNDRCWKRHGRWASDNSKDRYVKDSTANKLAVTKALRL